MTHLRNAFLAILSSVAIALMLAVPAVAQEDADQPDERPGIGITGFSALGRGAGVSTVLPGYPADDAGLRPGDVITQVEDAEIENFQDLADELSNYDAGDTVSITYRRGPDARTVEVTLELIPVASRDGDLPLFGGRPDDLFGEPDDEQPGDSRDDGDFSGRDDDDDDDDAAVAYLGVIVLFGVLICGFLGTLIVLKIKDRKRGSGNGSSPEEVARMRYAKGEITQAQFRLLMSDLGHREPETGAGQGPPPADAGKDSPEEAKPAADDDGSAVKETTDDAEDENKSQGENKSQEDK